MGALLVAAGAPFLIAMQTDFGVRTPPGGPGGLTNAENVTVVRPNHSGAFSCTVRSVTDGDTFRCTNGTRVRLSSIDAPEMPGSCRPGRTCAPGDPYAAKAALQRLIGGRTLRCEKVGMSYNRVAAWCSAKGVDLSCAMFRNGYAMRLAQFDQERRLCR